MDWLARCFRRDCEHTIAQLVRYAVAGAVSFVVDIAVILVLAEGFDVHYLLSSILGYLVALVLEYGASIRWVFAHRSIADARLEFLAFSALGIAGLGMNTLVMHLCTSALGMHYLVSKFPAGFAVLVATFVVRRALLFRAPPSEHAEGFAAASGSSAAWSSVALHRPVL